MGSFLACIWAAICSRTLAGTPGGAGRDDDIAVFQLEGRPACGSSRCRLVDAPDFRRGVMISPPVG
jgi:hypothetical protein